MEYAIQIYVKQEILYDDLTIEEKDKDMKPAMDGVNEALSPKGSCFINHPDKKLLILLMERIINQLPSLFWGDGYFFVRLMWFKKFQIGWSHPTPINPAEEKHLSNEKSPGCSGNIVDDTTQLCGDYDKPLQRSL